VRKDICVPLLLRSDGAQDKYEKTVTYAFSD